MVLAFKLTNSLDVMGTARLRTGKQGSAQTVNLIKEIIPHRHAALSKCLYGNSLKNVNEFTGIFVIRYFFYQKTQVQLLSCGTP